MKITFRQTRLIYFLGGAFMSFISYIGLIQAHQYMEIKEKGSPINVIIVGLPRNCDGTSNQFFEFKYKNKVYSKKVRGSICERNLKDTITLVYYNKYPKDFFLPRKNPYILEIDWYSSAVLGIFGLFLIYISTFPPLWFVKQFH